MKTRYADMMRSKVYIRMRTNGHAFRRSKLACAVLNKKDLRTLLKWRQALRTTWQARVQVDTGKTDEADAESGSEAVCEMWDQAGG